MEKKLYLVETVSMFRMRFVIEAKEASHAEDEVTMNINGDLSEFSQQHIAENIVSTREISNEEYLGLFMRDNAYLASWSDEDKFKFVNKIDYEE